VRENYILKKLVLGKYIILKMFIKTFQKCSFLSIPQVKMMLSR